MKHLVTWIFFLSSLSCFTQNVGINTTGATPDASAMLDIVSTDKGLLIPRVSLTGTTDATTISSPVTSLMVYNTATVSDVTPGFYYWNGTTWVRLINDGDPSGGDWSLTGNAGTTVGTNFIGTTDAQDLAIYTNNGETMRATQAGRIGIGTTAPGSKLEVSGADQVEAAIIIDNTGSVANRNDVIFYGKSNGNIMGQIEIGTKTTNNDDGRIIFYTRNSNSVNAAMTIANTGSVGIGTTSPTVSSLLDVSANDKGFLLPRVSLTGTTDATTILSPAVSLLVFNTATISDVTPGFYSWSGTKWVRILNYGNSSGGDWSLTGNAGTTVGTNFIGTTDAQDLAIYTNNTEALRVTQSGALGIGATAPSSKLEVVGQSLTETTLILHNDGSVANRNSMGVNFMSNSKEIASIQGETTSTNNFNGMITFHVRESGAVTEKMRFTELGYLGIGTTTPSYQLQLSTNSAAKPGTNTWTVASDARLKTNIKPYSDGLDLIKKIKPVWFTYNGKAGIPKETNIGVIAQDIQEIAPYMISEFVYKTDENSVEEYLGVDNGAMTYMLINAVKELNEKNEKLEFQIQVLSQKIEELSTK